MKKMLNSAFIGLCALGFSANSVAGDGCYICKSSSKDGIQQCKYGSSDTQDKRKQCKKAGCDIGGTASCSTAANVKVIAPN